MTAGLRSDRGVSQASHEVCLAAGLDPRRLPRHVAIIMDGNGRWAQQAGWQRLRGHERGAETVRTITTTAAELGIERLTLYAFSSENWSRPRLEIDGLMRLLVRFLKNEASTLAENNVRLTAIGRLTTLPDHVQRQLAASIEAASEHSGLDLCLALAYGGRQELVDAVRSLLKDAGRNGVDLQALADKIDENSLQSALYAPEAPDVDLLIRTAGEQRISNFLPWQTVYAEYFAATPLWPEFSRDDFLAALVNYQQRERRFGKTGDQVRKRDQAYGESAPDSTTGND